jgi:2-(3-amino-3-carboxypropyl)histidine synthase
MKIIHVPVTSDVKVELPSSFTKKLPKSVGLFMTAQFISRIASVKAQLESAGITVTLFPTRHTQVPGQILGCNVQKFEGVEAFVYVGDGLFHPLALLSRNAVPVHTWNPLTEKADVLSPDRGEKERKRLYGVYAKFLQARNVGVLISVKGGQYGLEVAGRFPKQGLDRYLDLEKEYPDKRFTFLVDNTCNLAGLEDFPFLEALINTACPRIAIDDHKNTPLPLLNIEDLMLLKEGKF